MPQSVLWILLFDVRVSKLDNTEAQSTTAKNQVQQYLWLLICDVIFSAIGSFTHAFALLLLCGMLSNLFPILCLANRQ
jgi:hypothetical protein